MEKSLKDYTKQLIIRSFDMEAQDNINEDQLEIILAERIEYLLANRLEFFFSTMYRMDVNEDKINQALQVSSPKPSIVIARLIIQRQKEKQASREKYRSDMDFFEF